MINGMVLILILLIFRSLMAMSLNVPLMVYIYLNFIRFARASSHVTDFNNRNKFYMPNFLGKVIGIINFAKHFPNFIVGTLN